MVVPAIISREQQPTSIAHLKEPCLVVSTPTETSVKGMALTPASRRANTTSGESMDSSRKHGSAGTRLLGSASSGFVLDDLLDLFRRAIVFLS